MQFPSRDIQLDSKWDSLPTWDFSSDVQAIKPESLTSKHKNDVLELSGLMSAQCSGYVLGRCKLVLIFKLMKKSPKLMLLVPLVANLPPRGPNLRI